MEDGEIADSDEDLPTTGGYHVPSMPACMPRTNAFQPREGVRYARPNSEQHLTARPRKRATSSGSSSGQSDFNDKDVDSDTDSVPINAAPQCRTGPPPSQHQANVPADCLPASAALLQRPAARVNNVWGSVLAEQTLTQELTDIGVVRKLVSNDRNVESYDYRRLTRSQSSSTESSLSEGSEYEGDNSTSAAVSRPTSGGSSRSHSSDSRSRESAAADSAHPSASKQRIPAKERLGKAPDVVSSVTTESSPEAVACYIATKLQEPKGSLIGRVVDVLGTEKALQLFHKTRDIEDAGGIMTLDGSRRRTPGGVFIVLMRKEVTKDQQRQIFALEMQLEKEKEKQKRKRARQRVNAAVKKARVDTRSAGEGQAAMAVDNLDAPEPVEAQGAAAAEDAALLANDPDLVLE